MFPRFGLTGLLIAATAMGVRADEIKLRTRNADPFGSPRPTAGQQHVPLRTTFFVELGMAEKGSRDVVVPESVAIELEPAGGKPFPILHPDRKFAEGYTGRFIPGKGDANGATIAVYVEPMAPLRPATTYTIRVTAQSRAGAVLPEKARAWQFTTEAETKLHPLEFKLRLNEPAIRWEGGFFTGFCNVAFCTSHSLRIPTYDLMAEVRKTAPKAWSLQRDFWLTGMEQWPNPFASNLPNIVRERETRRVTAITDSPDGSLLRVEDFFGHRQYGIPANRPVSDDYHLGDEILVCDGVNSTRAKVVKVDDKMKAVLVSRMEAPKGGWKLDYLGKLPTKEDPNAPGLFPPGGCHLLKFRPHGTPAYYWARLDREWDLAQKQYHRRVVPNFADAPGDLAIDGRPWTTAKDYAELHEVVRTIAGHIIDRYGDAALTFPWSVFNEPDLGAAFWRSDWDELQKFYDYTSDAILRAFEDRGYDSSKVRVGGLELAGIFGIHLRLKEFLVHCSPRAQQVQGAILRNAAFADKRLDGKRSKRVEGLCKANGGRGSPCDFISVHAYNASKMMADKVIKAKETALEIDADYYAKLWVNSHESCPEWAAPPDPAYGDSYLGNGYFPTWCADVARRQLRRAADDPRYGYGESILTVWPWPNANFGGGNDCVRAIESDDGRTVTVAMPILHFLGLLAQMGPEFHVLPEQTVGGHVVSGMASRDGKVTRVLLYTHSALDTESRSDATFEITLRLSGLAGEKFTVTEYRFDKDHNTYFRLGRRLRDQAAEKPSQSERLRDALRSLESDKPETQMAALDRLSALGPAASEAAAAIFHLHQKSNDGNVREKAKEVLKKVMSPKAYPAAEVKKVEELSGLRTTGSSMCEAADGVVKVQVRVAANGANFLVIESRPGRKY
jgi:hypothetical protein